MARPKKPDNEKRTKSVRFVVTDIERAQIEQAAAAHGLGLSEFFRRLALSEPMPAPDRQLRAETTTALLRLGVNLNQIAHRMNAGRSVSSRLIDDLINRINSTMDKLDESGGNRPRP